MLQNSLVNIDME